MSSHVEFHRFPHGETCTTEGCRSRRYYIADGSQYCKSHGHRQEGFTQIQADEDDFNSQGRKTRKRKERAEKVERVLSGRKATELFLNCYQLVLWKCVKDFERKLCTRDGELETVVRDLWSVRLRAVKELEGGQGMRASSTCGGEGSDTDGGGLYSSMTDGESGSDGSRSVISSAGRMKGRRRGKMNGIPKLTDTLGLCYLGCILLRLPVSLGDLHKWVETDEIIQFRVIREIPKEMWIRLPPYYLASFEIRTPLKVGVLHSIVTELVISFKQSFELQFPPINAPLLMFKHIKSLCLPLDVLIGARNLAGILQQDFSYPDFLARHQVSMWPEVQVMSYIIVATKLSQNLNDLDIVPMSSTDPTAVAVNWDLWRSQRTSSGHEPFPKAQMDLSPEDVMNMNGNQLDEYLGWYQKVWVDDHDAKMPQQILDLFPLPSVEVDVSKQSKASATSLEDIPHSETLKKVQSNMKWHGSVDSAAVASSEVLRSPVRPGMSYRHYRNVGELSPTAKILYEQAANCAGVTLETLTRAVFLLESKLENWVATEKRKERAAEYEKWERTEYLAALSEQDYSD